MCAYNRIETPEKRWKPKKRAKWINEVNERNVKSQRVMNEPWLCANNTKNKTKEMEKREKYSLSPSLSISEWRKRVIETDEKENSSLLECENSWHMANTASFQLRGSNV